MKFWIPYAGALAVIFCVGWREPLRYRFMSSEEIALAQNPPRPQKPDTRAWMWEKNRSRLEQPATDTRQGVFNERR